MKMIILIVICFLLLPIYFWGQKNSYLIENKGVYVHYQPSDKKLKVPYKQGIEFYFSLKNDSVAIVQDIINGKLQKEKEYQISPSYDTTYVKRYPSIDKKKVKIEKLIYRRVY